MEKVLEKTSRQAGASLQQIPFLPFFPVIKPASSASKTWKKLPEGSVGSSEEQRGSPSLENSTAFPSLFHTHQDHPLRS